MMSFTPAPRSISELPAVDDRLAEPGTRYEVEDGRRVYVPPADEPHGESHFTVGALVKAHRADGYSGAVDMLTRTSRSDDLAPDVSLYPSARDPRTGGRQLEELAFEVASTQSLGHVGKRAAKLVARGVRRVFALDVERMRALEWSSETGEWKLLERSGRIEDPALAVPIPIDALLDAALADDAIARALRVKRHPEFLAEREEGRAEGEARGRAEGRAEGEARGRAEGEARGRAEGLLAVLALRGLEPTEDERDRIRQERDLGRLGRWLAAARTCADVAELLAVP
jgi:Uma2 family endonuclease